MDTNRFCPTQRKQPRILDTETSEQGNVPATLVISSQNWTTPEVMQTRKNEWKAERHEAGYPEPDASELQLCMYPYYLLTEGQYINMEPVELDEWKR